MDAAQILYNKSHIWPASHRYFVIANQDLTLWLLPFCNLCIFPVYSRYHVQVFQSTSLVLATDINYRYVLQIAIGLRNIGRIWHKIEVTTWPKIKESFKLHLLHILYFILFPNILSSKKYRLSVRPCNA